jgi:hypothetical protein
MSYLVAPDPKITLEEVIKNKFFDSEKNQRYHYNAIDFFVLYYYSHDLDFGMDLVKLVEPEQFLANQKRTKFFSLFLKRAGLTLSLFFSSPSIGNANYFDNKIPTIIKNEKKNLNSRNFAEIRKNAQEYAEEQKKQKIDQLCQKINETNNPSLVYKYVKELKKLGHDYELSGLKKEYMERSRKENAEFQRNVLEEKKRVEFFTLFAHHQMGFPIKQKQKNLPFSPVIQKIFAAKQEEPQNSLAIIYSSRRPKVVRKLTVEKIARNYSSKTMPFPVFVLFMDKHFGFTYFIDNKQNIFIEANKKIETTKKEIPINEKKIQNTGENTKEIIIEKDAPK